MAGAMDAIVTKIRMMVSRGVLALVDDAKKMQAVQVTGFAGETLDNVEHPQPYGFTSSPLPGAEAFMMFVGGDRSHGIALVIDDRRYRLKPLGDGEVALYNHEGSSVVLRNGNKIEVDAAEVVVRGQQKISLEAGAEIAMTAPIVTMQSAAVNTTGAIRADGNMTALASGNAIAMNAIRSAFNQHVHFVNNEDEPSNPPFGGVRI